MTDRELLELAAKAAGIKTYGAARGFEGLEVRDGSDYWSPLTDDGDALRLAVKLEIGILQIFGTARARTKGLRNDFTAPYAMFNGDPLAATRRAIVCAAAEIGRAMP